MFPSCSDWLYRNVIFSVFHTDLSIYMCPSLVGGPLDHNCTGAAHTFSSKTFTRYGTGQRLATNAHSKCVHFALHLDVLNAFVDLRSLSADPLFCLGFVEIASLNTERAYKWRLSGSARPS